MLERSYGCGRGVVVGYTAGRWAGPGASTGASTATDALDRGAAAGGGARRGCAAGDGAIVVVVDTTTGGTTDEDGSGVPAGVGLAAVGVAADVLRTRVVGKPAALVLGSGAGEVEFATAVEGVGSAVGERVGRPVGLGDGETGAVTDAEAGVDEGGVTDRVEDSTVELEEVDVVGGFDVVGDSVVAEVVVSVVVEPEVVVVPVVVVPEVVEPDVVEPEVVVVSEAAGWGEVAATVGTGNHVSGDDGRTGSGAPGARVAAGSCSTTL